MRGGLHGIYTGCIAVDKVGRLPWCGKGGGGNITTTLTRGTPPPAAPERR